MKWFFLEETRFSLFETPVKFVQADEYAQGNECSFDGSANFVKKK